MKTFKWKNFQVVFFVQKIFLSEIWVCQKVFPSKVCVLQFFLTLGKSTKDKQRPLSKKLLNMTNHSQPVDLTMSSPAKEFLKCGKQVK